MAGEPRFRAEFQQLTSVNIGAGALGSVIVEERGNAQFHQTLLTFQDVPIAVSDSNVGGGTKVYDFPEGRILILGATAKALNPTTASVLASTLNASATLSMGLGTVQTTSQGSGTLATTQQDIIPTCAPVSSAVINTPGTAANAALAVSAQFDGTATKKSAYLNLGVPTATDIDGDATVTVTGSVLITWVFLGDY